MKLRATFALCLGLALVVFTQNVEGQDVVECDTKMGPWSDCINGFRERSQECTDKPKGCNSCSVGTERDTCQAEQPPQRPQLKDETTSNHQQPHNPKLKDQTNSNQQPPKLRDQTNSNQQPPKLRDQTTSKQDKGKK